MFELHEFDVVVVEHDAAGLERLLRHEEEPVKEMRHHQLTANGAHHHTRPANWVVVSGEKRNVLVVHDALGHDIEYAFIPFGGVIEAEEAGRASLWVEINAE